MICYVCKGHIKKGDGIYIGQDKYRHYSCEAGTSVWLASDVGIQSPIRDIFLKAQENTRCRKPMILLQTVLFKEEQK